MLLASSALSYENSVEHAGTAIVYTRISFVHALSTPSSVRRHDFRDWFPQLFVCSVRHSSRGCRPPHRQQQEDLLVRRSVQQRPDLRLGSHRCRRQRDQISCLQCSQEDSSSNARGLLCIPATDDGSCPMTSLRYQKCARQHEAQVL